MSAMGGRTDRPGIDLYIKEESREEIGEYRRDNDTWDDAVQRVLTKAAKYDEEKA